MVLEWPAALPTSELPAQLAPHRQLFAVAQLAPAPPHGPHDEPVPGFAGLQPPLRPLDVVAVTLPLPAGRLRRTVNPLAPPTFLVGENRQRLLRFWTLSPHVGRLALLSRFALPLGVAAVPLLYKEPRPSLVLPSLPLWALALHLEPALERQGVRRLRVLKFVP